MNCDEFFTKNNVNSRRTRHQIKKLIEPHKIEVKNVSDVEIVCDFNSQEMKVKIHEERKEILDVSCFECENFCEHKEVLVLYLSKLPIDELKEGTSGKRRRSEGDDENSGKRQKTDEDAENSSAVANVQFPVLKITKKKKKEKELTPKQLKDIEDVNQVFNMANLVRSFGRGKYEDFYQHCVDVMNENLHLIERANKLTIEQADTDLWHQLRIGRVTASRLYETTRCTTKNGSLIDKYLGKSSGWSFAMMRGTVLEDYVFNVLEVQKEYPTLQRCGLIMNPSQHPLFAASPDGIHEDFVLEIKCPGTPNTFKQYTNLDLLNKKYFAQIQLQMFVTGKTKALLAVASLDFESTRGVTKLWIERDEDYVTQMIKDASNFYEDAIWPALKRKFLS